MLVGDIAHWRSHFKRLDDRMSDAIDIAWPTCIARLRARTNELTHEDHITNHLVAELIRNKKVPGRILPQYTLLVDDPVNGVALPSRIDFVLTIGNDENVYLAFECKRLNVSANSGKTRSLAGEYVDEGLMRFVTGQYSNGLPRAMMLGYVMDARVDRARTGLARAMSRRSKAIRLKATREDPPRPGRSRRFTTIHGCLSGHDIFVAHTLLGWS